MRCSRNTTVSEAGARMVSPHEKKLEALALDTLEMEQANA